MPIARGGGILSRRRIVASKDKVEGEGSYSGTKDYNQRTKKFIESGKVDQAAEDAKPESEQQAHEMHKAERIGKQKAKK
jgi:hypothetical protein